MRVVRDDGSDMLHKFNNIWRFMKFLIAAVAIAYLVILFTRPSEGAERPKAVGIASAANATEQAPFRTKTGVEIADEALAEMCREAGRRYDPSRLQCFAPTRDSRQVEDNIGNP